MVDEQGRIELKGDLEISGAEIERRRILDLLDGPAGVKYNVDISGEKMTQPALQIFFAVLNEARGRDLVLELGPRAEALDRSRTDAGKEFEANDQDNPLDR